MNVHSPVLKMLLWAVTCRCSVCFYVLLLIEWDHPTSSATDNDHHHAGHHSPPAPILYQCLAFLIGMSTPFPYVVQALLSWSTPRSGPFHCFIHHHQSQLTCTYPTHMAEILFIFKNATLAISSRLSFCTRKIDSSVLCSLNQMPRIHLQHHISKEFRRYVSQI
jgi:hypothetical protein